MSKTIHINIPISKIDEEQRIITGIATTEALDSQGDIVDYEASKKAFTDWPGNIREMHGNVAIGKGIDTQFDDDAKTVTVSAKISESADGENAWIKIKEGVLAGFSIGGRVLEVAKDKAVDGANRILDYTLSELSVVDNPANPQAELIMVKSVSGGKLQRVEEITKSDGLLPEPYWVNKFMRKPMNKGRVNVIDGDPRDHKAGTASDNVNGGIPPKVPTVVPKKVYGADGISTTTKSVYDAGTAINLATELAWLIMSESWDDEADAEQLKLLTDAFNGLKEFTAQEVTENDDYLGQAAEVMELAQTAIDLRKGKLMSEVKKTNVIGGEERDLDAKVTETAEESGRPVNDTTERAADAGVPAATDGEEAVHADGTTAADAKDAKAVQDAAGTDVTPPADDKPVDDKKPDDEADDEGEKIPVKTDKDDEKKSDSTTDLLKNVQALLIKLNDKGADTDLKKVSDVVEKLSDKVEKSIASLEDRIATLEKTPVAPKGKQYAVIDKGGNATEDTTELETIKKRQEHLALHPQDAKPGEPEAIFKFLRAHNTAEQIIIK